MQEFPFLRFVPEQEPLPLHVHNSFLNLCYEKLNQHFCVNSFPTRINALPMNWPFSLFPIKYKNQYVTFFSDLERCHDMDSLSDVFQEPVRVKTRLQEYKYSAYDYWQQYSEQVKRDAAEWNDGLITPRTCRRSLFHLAPSAPYFRTTLARCIYQLFQSKNVLDPCSGWGDRLLAALSLQDTGINYTGVDPNPDLFPGYHRIVREFSAPHTQNRYHLIPLPIQKAEAEIVPRGPFDLVFTSPPFFDREVYNTEDTNQSIYNIQSVEEWQNQFLYPCLQICWRNLKPGGILVLSINDFGKHMKPRHRYVLDLQKYLSQISDAQYQGCIPFHGYRTLRRTQGKPERAPQPLWVWKKKPDV